MDYGRSNNNMWDNGQPTKNQEDLLVFGYSCKLFRDDEKANYIDQGKHLVPWMNDPNLQIDRFDVRGALYDLTEAESKGRALEEILNEAELKEEQICEQERYFALYHDEYQVQADIEEEAKRLQVEISTDESYYNQVGLDYNNHMYSEGYPQPPYQQEAQLFEAVDGNTYNPIADEDTYIPPPELNIPNGMEVPQTIKQNKIILKTAKFIVTQGAQMEIVIKTKQAGNSMFNFLAFDHPLNAYYKHVVFMIRMGKYKCEDDTENDANKDQDMQYLHPNLSQNVKPDLTPGISTPTPNVHCSYSKLISKIREKQIASGVEETEIYSLAAPSSPIVHSSAVKNADTPRTIFRNPELTPIQSQQPIVGLVDYPSFNQTADGSSDVDDSDTASAKKSTSKTSMFRLASHDYSKIKWPPPDVQMVIDKMASYIIKNGPAFEEVVCSRDDARFEFLKPTHQYHAYYQCKIQLYNEVYGEIFKNTPKVNESRKKTSPVSSKKYQNAIPNSSGGSRTISFSIKSREQEVPLTNKTTFPIESSTSEEDEEMTEEEREKKRIEREERRHARRLKEKEKKEKEEMLKRMLREEEDKRRKEEDSSGNEDLYDIFKYAQEMQREKASSAQQKSSQSVFQDKQLERKKKAAAFLSKLKGGKEKPEAVYGPSLPPDALEGSFQSPSSRSRSSSIDSRNSLPPPPQDPPTLPLPQDSPKLPPPPPRVPSPPGILETISETLKLDSAERSPSISKWRESKETLSSLFHTGQTDGASSKSSSKRASESREVRVHKSRSHKKHSRGKSESRSPSSKREKKKRKRSCSHRRKKRRSRSRSESKSHHAKSHRSSHHKKKHGKRSSHKDKSKKKKHRKVRSPSSSSEISLPSSDSTSSTLSTLPSSESDSEMDVQVIDTPPEENGNASRGSSVVSLPSTSQDNNVPSSSSKFEDYLTNDENTSQSSSQVLPTKHSLSSMALSLIPPDENTSSSLEFSSEGDKKALFNPSTSNAMAKITQGLRAKLQALLEQDVKPE